MDPVAVFAATDRWLQRERAKVLIRQPGAYIEALHGTKAQMMAWKPNARKTVRFRFWPADNGTVVDVEVELSVYYAGDPGASSASGRGRMAFDGWLTGLWRQMGAGSTVSAAEASALARQGKSQARAMMIAGAVLMPIGAVAYLLVRASGGPAAVATLAGWIALAGLLPLGYGVFYWLVERNPSPRSRR